MDTIYKLKVQRVDTKKLKHCGFVPGWEQEKKKYYVKDKDD